jgi:CBS domain-containing protein
MVKGYDIWTIDPNATVYVALRLMADKDVGALLVMDGETLVGIISERDYSRKIILKGKTSRETQVHEAMMSTFPNIHPDQTIEECMELMTRHHTRYVPVIEDDHLIGVISLGDVVRSIIYKQRETIKDLEKFVLGTQSISQFV